MGRSDTTASIKKATLALKGPRKHRWFDRVDLLTSLILVFPVFLLYQVGVLFLPGVTNGADLITLHLLRLLHGQVVTYALVNAALGLGFIILILILRKRGTFQPRLFVPVILESAIYALTMGSLILFVMQDILHVDPRLAVASHAPVVEGGPLTKLVLALGAGFHEELLFRLGLLSGIYVVGRHVFNWGRVPAGVSAFLLSSLLFSAAHHVIGGEAFFVGVFTYRLLCGIWFGVLYEVRGFAVAVYTHALYDIYVMLIRGQ
jgi:hypothetical protein